MKLTLNFFRFFITILSTNLKSSTRTRFFEEQNWFYKKVQIFLKVHHAHNPSSHRYSFLWGLLLGIPVGIFVHTENPNFYIQPQIEYIQTGEKGKKYTLCK